MKTLSAKDTETVKGVCSDLEVYGNPDVWVLIAKASSKSQGWMKSTKAMAIPATPGNHRGSVVVQVTTEHRDSSGFIVASEALTTVNNAYIEKLDDGTYAIRTF